jgi:hypothetical protein
MSSEETRIQLASQKQKAGSLKMNTALEYSTRVVQEGGRRCKKSTLNDFSKPDPSKNTFNEPAKSRQSGQEASRNK